MDAFEVAATSVTTCFLKWHLTEAMFQENSCASRFKGFVRSSHQRKFIIFGLVHIVAVFDANSDRFGFQEGDRQIWEG